MTKVSRKKKAFLRSHRSTEMTSSTEPYHPKDAVLSPNLIGEMEEQWIQPLDGGGDDSPIAPPPITSPKRSSSRRAGSSHRPHLSTARRSKSFDEHDPDMGSPRRREAYRKSNRNAPPRSRSSDEFETPPLLKSPTSRSSRSSDQASSSRTSGKQRRTRPRSTERVDLHTLVDKEEYSDRRSRSRSSERISLMDSPAGRSMSSPTTSRTSGSRKPSRSNAEQQGSDGLERLKPRRSRSSENHADLSGGYSSVKRGSSNRGGNNKEGSYSSRRSGKDLVSPSHRSKSGKCNQFTSGTITSSEEDDQDDQADIILPLTGNDDVEPPSPRRRSSRRSKSNSSDEEPNHHEANLASPRRAAERRNKLSLRRSDPDEATSEDMLSPTTRQGRKSKSGSGGGGGRSSASSSRRRGTSPSEDREEDPGISPHRSRAKPRAIDGSSTRTPRKDPRKNRSLSTERISFEKSPSKSSSARHRSISPNVDSMVEGVGKRHSDHGVKKSVSPKKKVDRLNQTSHAALPSPKPGASPGGDISRHGTEGIDFGKPLGLEKLLENPVLLAEKSSLPAPSICDDNAFVSDDEESQHSHQDKVSGHDSDFDSQAEDGKELSFSELAKETNSIDDDDFGGEKANPPADDKLENSELSFSALVQNNFKGGGFSSDDESKDKKLVDDSQNQSQSASAHFQASFGELAKSAGNASFGDFAETRGNESFPEPTTIPKKVENMPASSSVVQSVTEARFIQVDGVIHKLDEDGNRIDTKKTAKTEKKKSKIESKEAKQSKKKPMGKLGGLLKRGQGRKQAFGESISSGNNLPGDEFNDDGGADIQQSVSANAVMNGPPPAPSPPPSSPSTSQRAASSLPSTPEQVTSPRAGRKSGMLSPRGLKSPKALINKIPGLMESPKMPKMKTRRGSLGDEEADDRNLLPRRRNSVGSSSDGFRSEKFSPRAYTRSSRRKSAGSSDGLGDLLSKVDSNDQGQAIDVSRPDSPSRTVASRPDFLQLDLGSSPASHIPIQAVPRDRLQLVENLSTPDMSDGGVEDDSPVREVKRGILGNFGKGKRGQGRN